MTDFTEFCKFAKIPVRTVGYADTAHTSLDAQDYAGRGNYFVGIATEAISAYDLVGWTDPTTDANELSLAKLSLGIPVIGMALASVAIGEPVPIITKGWVERASGWTLTGGTTIFAPFGGTAGLMYLDDDAVESGYIGSGLPYLLQRVGHVSEANTRIWINPDNPYIGVNDMVVSDPYNQGSLTRSIKDIGSGQMEQVFSFAGSGGPKNLIFSFILPRNFWKFADLSIAGFEVMYRAAAGGNIDITAVYDGQGGLDAAVVATAGTSTTWTTYTLEMSKFNAGTMAPAANKAVHVVVQTNGTGVVDVASKASLRFVPNLLTTF